MKKRILNIVSLLLVTAVVFSLAACKGNVTPEQEIDNTAKAHTKNTTAQAVEIAGVPESKTELTEMFNSALDYVDLYCYRYTKAVKCDVKNVSVGSLASVSNSYDAFKSIFGMTDTKSDYDYKASKELFADNFVAGGFTGEDISEITAKQSGDKIIITVTFPDESNPGGGGLLGKLSNSYVSAEDVKESLTQFNSSASHVGVSASQLKAVATVSARDSSLEKLVISYTQRFSLSGVTLVKVEGSGVSGISETVVTYTDMG